MSDDYALNAEESDMFASFLNAPKEEQDATELPPQPSTPRPPAEDEQQTTERQRPLTPRGPPEDSPMPPPDST
jgi:hypothetical protein